MKYLGAVDKLSKAGWSLGWVSAVILAGAQPVLLTRTAMMGKRFVVRAEEKLTAFLGR